MGKIWYGILNQSVKETDSSDCKRGIARCSSTWNSGSAFMAHKGENAWMARSKAFMDV